MPASRAPRAGTRRPSRRRRHPRRRSRRACAPSSTPSRADRPPVPPPRRRSPPTSTTEPMSRPVPFGHVLWLARHRSSTHSRSRPSSQRWYRDSNTLSTAGWIVTDARRQGCARSVEAMCGRFAMDDKTNDLIEQFVLDGNDFRDWVPSFSIAPTDPVPVIRERARRTAARCSAGSSPRSGTSGRSGCRPTSTSARSSTRASRRSRRTGCGRRRSPARAASCRCAATTSGPARPGAKDAHFIHGSGPARRGRHLHAAQGRDGRVVPDDVDHHAGGARRLGRGARPDAGLPRAGRLRPLAVAGQARGAGRARRAGDAARAASRTRSPAPSRPTRSTAG